MPKVEVAKSSTSRKTVPSKQPRARRMPAKSIEVSARATSSEPARLNEAPLSPRTMKQEQVLTLLSGRAGASIEDLITATDWQQHSVRGFLAGTVKKKLGFNLTSSKVKGDVRRYRIKSRGGR
jgi:hypothetical protein